MPPKLLISYSKLQQLRLAAEDNVQRRPGRSLLTPSTKNVQLSVLEHGQEFDSTLFMWVVPLLCFMGFNYNSEEAFGQLKKVVIERFRVCNEAYFDAWAAIITSEPKESNSGTDRKKTANQIRWEQK